MIQMGDYDATETVHIPVNTFDSNDPSASVTVTDLAAGDVEIYKDGSDTQRTGTSGVTVSINFDGGTGAHFINIDLSDNDDAGFYALGSRFSVMLVGITVDAGTLNAWVGSFSMGCVLRPTTAGRTLDVTAAGEAGLDLDNTSGTLDAAQIGGDAITAAKIADDAIVAANFATGALTADAFAVDAIVAATLATNAITTDAFADGTITAAKIAGDAITAAKIADDAIVAANFATGALTADAFAVDALVAATFATNAISDDAVAADVYAQVQDEVDASLVAIHLDHLLAATYDPASKPGVADALLNEIVENDGGVSRFTSNALEQGPSGSGGDATEAKQDSIIAAVITNAAGDDVAADIIAVKAETVEILADVTGLNGDVMVGTDGANTVVPATKAEMDTGHGLLATEAKQDIIDTNVDQLETAIITNATGTDIAADIIALKAETVLIVEDTGTTLDALIKDIPTVAEFEARTLEAAAYFDVTSDGVIVTTNNDKTGMALSAAGVDAILDETIGDGTLTMRQTLQVCISALAGKLSGGGTATLTFRNVADDRSVITATVDGDDDRTAMTVNPV